MSAGDPARSDGRLSGVTLGSADDEIQKPAEMARRGGQGMRTGNFFAIHLGVEIIPPCHQAHPAIVRTV